MRRLVLFALLALLVAACGGGSGEESSDSTASGTDTDSGTETTQAESSGDDSQPTTTQASDDSPDDGGGDVEGVGVGTATIAGETYEFGDVGQPGLQCLPAAFGVAFLAALQSTDGGGGAIVVGIPFPGEEDTAGIMPELSVSTSELDWMANAERASERGIPDGSSQVDSYEINGNTITGTATFYEENSSFSGVPEDLVVETGTFEVTCAG